MEEESWTTDTPPSARKSDKSVLKDASSTRSVGSFLPVATILDENAEEDGGLFIDFENQDADNDIKDDSASGPLHRHPKGNPALEDEPSATEKKMKRKKSHPKKEKKRSPESFLPVATVLDGSAEDDGGIFIDFDNQGDENDINYEDAKNGENDAEYKVSPKAQQEDEAIVQTALMSTSPLSSKTSFPTRSILKAQVDEEIPIRTNKNRWRKLPAPDMEYVKMKRIQSLNSIASRNSSPDLTSSVNDDFQKPPPRPLKSPESPSPATRKSDSKVAFQHIVVREYQQTIGDNPSVGEGAPISLDWNYQQNEALDVDLYECTRAERRNVNEMRLTHYQRKCIFMHQYGFSESEVKAARTATNKVRSQREFSRMMQTSFQSVLELEEMRESAVRKFRRYRRRNSIEVDISTWKEAAKEEESHRDIPEPILRRVESAPI
ncbi:MAG: hypothetical protein SGBAC_002948 [Bacillariaceae sp.]